MPGFGFKQGFSRSRTALDTGIIGGGGGEAFAFVIGALTRSEFGAGVEVTGTQVTSGDEAGHWIVSGGRLFPSPAGAAAELDSGPYSLRFDDGSTAAITIEPGTWDVTDQSEWDFVAMQPASVLSGKAIALRNAAPISLGITGGSGTPLRRVDLRDAEGTPLTIKGRFGEPGEWADYCEIDRVAFLRGTRGVTFSHLRTTPAAETKFAFIGESTRPADDITLDDCFVSGEVGDPNGDYSNSANYPNRNRDLIATTGSAPGSVGNITITNCFIEWGASLVNIAVTRAGSQLVIAGNTCRYFYDDGIAVAQGSGAAGLPVTISDNFMIDAVGKATDSDNPHVDAVRVLGASNATADWTDITIENNIILKGTARGEMQAMLLDDMKTSSTDSGHFFSATIRNNIIACDSFQGIWVNQAANCLIDQNTVVGYGEVAASTPTINCGTISLNDTNGGGNAITNNVSDSFGVSPTDTSTGNVTTGRNGSSVPYSSLFDGPLFAPVDEAEARSAFQPKTGAGATPP